MKGATVPNANTFPPAQDGHFIEVAGLDLVFKPVPLADHTPTGAQIASAAGYSDAQVVTVLHLLANGELEDIRPTVHVLARVRDDSPAAGSLWSSPTARIG